MRPPRPSRRHSPRRPPGPPWSTSAHAANSATSASNTALTARPSAVESGPEGSVLTAISPSPTSTSLRLPERRSYSTVGTNPVQFDEVELARATGLVELDGPDNETRSDDVRG